MLREAHIPIFLWLPAAILIHLATGGGASEMAKTVAEREAILRFSKSVRAQIGQEVAGEGKPTEVELIEDEPADQPPEPPKDEAQAKADEKADDAAEADKTKPKPREAVDTTKPPEKKKPEPKLADKKPEPKPPEKKLQPAPSPKLAEQKAKPKPEEKKPEEAHKTEPIAMPQGRIAIQNDPTLDPNQKDNPNAPRIADNANTVKEETQARFRSYDQNSPAPTGGGNPRDSADDQPGNADKEERGHSVEAPGEGPPKPGSDSGPDKPPEPVARSPLSPEQRIGQDGIKGQKAIAPREAGSGPKLPGALAGDKGSYSLDPDGSPDQLPDGSAGGDGKPKQEARKGRKGRRAQRYLEGLMQPGELPTRYSVNPWGLQAALGPQNLQAELEHARNVRLNKHRGAFKGLDFKKYRAAIENYDPVVKEGNTTSLNAARVSFAKYLNQMHNKIHPIYADGFLGSLASNPDPRLSDMKLFTHLEIILDGRTGRLVREGVVRSSGVAQLDVAALRSVVEAAPFGRAPDVIWSPDGRVYLHWEFYRNPYYACTSKFAYPYLLKAAPKHEEPAPIPPAAPPGPEDAPKYGSR